MPLTSFLGVVRSAIPVRDDGATAGHRRSGPAAGWLYPLRRKLPGSGIGVEDVDALIALDDMAVLRQRQRKVGVVEPHVAAQRFGDGVQEARPLKDLVGDLLRPCLAGWEGALVGLAEAL